MRVLVDTNVVLDVLLDRRPHAEAGGTVWAAVEAGKLEGVVAAHAITTIDYLIRKELGAVRARQTITSILRVFGVAPVDGPVIEDALLLPLPDFEDSVSCAAARRAGCEYIVSRDPKGFRGSPVRCLTPEATVPLFGSQ